MFALCPLIISCAQFYLINVKLVVMMSIPMDMNHTHPPSKLEDSSRHVLLDEEEKNHD